MKPNILMRVQDPEYSFRGCVMKYFDELKRSMEYLASDSRIGFIGQAVAVPGTAMSNTIADI